VPSLLQCEGHTGANVYKGMVGLFPIYDRADNGDETDPKTYRLPGVLNKETQRIDYDIPLAFFDCALDDGVTGHKDFHNGGGEAHPEWWGKTFFRHFPNHGFVGDIFTVNGTASPVMEVKRRKYRFRFLDASIARQYKFSLMSSTGGPKSSASLGYGGDELPKVIEVGIGFDF
jgi:FtsP/CotA-like multicopper oxidase with cupredoxin domain